MIKDVLSLTLSSVISQGLSFSVLIAVARIVSVEDYGVYAIALTIVGYLVILATAKYHHVIFSASEKEADVITEGSKVFSFWIILIATLGLIVAWYFFDVWKNLKLVHLLLVSIAAYFSAVNLFLYYNALRANRIRSIGISRIIPTFGGGAITLILTWVGLGTTGLLLGYIVILVWANILLRKTSKVHWSYAELFRILKMNIKFPAVLLPAGILEMFNSTFLILGSAHFFGLQVSAAFGLYAKLIVTPQSALVGAISDTIKKKLVVLEKNADVRIILLKVFGVVLVAGIAGSLAVYLVAAFGLEIIFGEKWAYAGPYFQFMIPIFIMSIAVPPISVILYMFNGQRYDLYLQLISAVLYIAVFGAAKYNSDLFWAGFLSVTIFKYALELYFSVRCLNERDEGP